MIQTIKRALIPSLNSGSPARVVSVRPGGGTIPRVIHQTFPTKALPPVLAENLARTRALNPDWEHRLYDDDDIAAFIKERFGTEVLRSYLRINPVYGAARADLFRYLALYDGGGVYLDIKAAALAPLSTAIRADDQYLLSQWPVVTTGRMRGWGMHAEVTHIPRGEFQQWCIVAAPGHPFLHAVIERVLANLDLYVPSVHGVGRGAVLRLTGPVAYTLAIAPLRERHPHRVVESEADLGFVYSIFEKAQHMQLFKTHYGTQSDPIVALGPRQRLLDIVNRGGRRLRAVVRRRPSAK